MHTPSLQIIPQRHDADCAVVVLAMVCGVSYEEALMAFRHNVYVKGASIRQLRAAARRLGRVLSYSRHVGDLELETGIICIRSDEWKMDHLVILKEGQIIDTDATLWDADVFLAAYKATPFLILKLKDEGDTV